jgi:hypothetical protein
LLESIYHKCLKKRIRFQRNFISFWIIGSNKF